MNFLVKSIFLLMFSNFLISGTFYLSESIDNISATKSVNQYGENKVNGVNFTTRSLGYYDTVWKKRKVKYNVNLGLEYVHNRNFNLIAFFTMINYDFTKNLFSSLYLGIDFYNHDFQNINEEIYHPDSKGGGMYGLGLTYILNKKFPVSLNYKIYNYSSVSQDVWTDTEYKRASLSFGYKF